MSRLEQYEAGALSAWTPASQAAMNATHHDKQILHDQLPALEAFKEEEALAQRPVKKALERAKAKGDKKELAKQQAELDKLDVIWGPEVRKWDFERDEQYQLKKEDQRKKEKRAVTYETAEAVNAGTVVDNLIMSWNPPLFAFLDILGPPHITIIAYVGAHIYFWYRAPWYLRFLIYYPTIYFIPLWSAFKSLKDKKSRLLWTVYFMQLAMIEYFELLFYRDRARSAVMFPKLKAMFCLISYMVVDPSTDPPTQGAIKLINYLLPPPAPPALTAAEKKEAKKASEARRAERTKKEEEKKEAAVELEKKERRDRRAKEGEWIAAH